MDINFKEQYKYDYEGFMEGQISTKDTELLLSGQKYINTDQLYKQDYEGEVTGTWEGLSQEDQITHKIFAYCVDDKYMVQGQAFLLNDNTWNSKVNDWGYKEFWLVDGDSEVIDYSNKYLTNYEVHIYAKTNSLKLIDKVKVWAINDKLIWYTVNGTVGQKIIRLIDQYTGDMVSEASVKLDRPIPPEIPPYVPDPPIDSGVEPEGKYEKAKWKAINFVKRMMDTSSFEVGITYDKEYSSYFTDMIMTGKVSKIPDPQISYNKYFEASQYYDYDYAGKVSGTWYSLPNPQDYKVEVNVIMDMPYFVGSCPLETDGTWSCSRAVQQGLKEFVLVDKKGNVVEYAYPYLTNYYVDTFSYGDTEYKTDKCKIFLVQSQYIFYSTKASKSGYKVCKVVRGSDSTVVGISSGYSNITHGRLPASFLVPEDDPNYDKDGTTAANKFGYMLNSRSFIYDVGLCLLLFTLSGDFDICKEMMERMKFEQNYDGSFNFSYDIYIGQLFESYKRTGAMGWLVWGMCYYCMISGDRSYNEMLEKVGSWILARQITDSNDYRYGLLTGGSGAYGPNYEYIDVQIEWCSTEHNCSTLQAITGLSIVLGDKKYKDSANNIKQALYNILYDKENGRFYQGCSATGIDDAWALDCSTWAGKSMLSILDEGIPKECVLSTEAYYLVQGKSILQSTSQEHYNTRYSLPNDTKVDGFKPYHLGYDGPPQLVWTEGTLGMVALLMGLGEMTRAYNYIDETIKLQNCIGSTGGVIYTTETWSSMPWEFHVWESVVSSSWLYIVLTDYNVLFPLTSKTLDLFNMSFNFENIFGCVVNKFK